MQNKFLKTGDTGLFLGNISDNILHKHYAIQIIISLDQSITISTPERHYKNTALAIQPLITHKLNSRVQKVLLVFINPASKLGHTINKHVLNKNIEEFNNAWTDSLKTLTHQWDNGEIDKYFFLKQYSHITKEYFTSCENINSYSDARIMDALQILESSSNKAIPLKTIAEEVSVSPSRFIHLFKNETGITYRRMQLWIKLMKSFELLPQVTNITELAHSSGFADSAHYSRTFKETFGIKPSFIMKSLLKQ